MLYVSAQTKFMEPINHYEWFIWDHDEDERDIQAK